MKKSELVELIREIIRSQNERELTKKEKSGLRRLEKSVSQKPFEKQYGKKEGEKIYYATLTKQAKKKY